MAELEIKDISIIGGGPTGLFAAFYAGMRGASARIIDALPALGGQLLALYPEKYIFDVAGFPKVLAKDLVRDMVAQGLQFGASTHLGQVVTGLRRVEDDGIGYYVLETSEGDYASRASYQRGFRETNDVSRRVAERNGVAFFDYAALMPTEKKYWHDGRHVNAEGARVKAELFAAFISEHAIAERYRGAIGTR